MNTTLNLVLKILLLSGGLAFIIKYLAPSLNIPATSINALIGVLLPTVILLGLLSWRMWRGEEASQ